MASHFSEMEDRSIDANCPDDFQAITFSDYSARLIRYFSVFQNVCDWPKSGYVSPLSNACFQS